jgi:hypothetical protein
MSVKHLLIQALCKNITRLSHLVLRFETRITAEFQVLNWVFLLINTSALLANELIMNTEAEFYKCLEKGSWFQFIKKLECPYITWDKTISILVLSAKFK